MKITWRLFALILLLGLHAEGVRGAAPDLQEGKDFVRRTAPIPVESGHKIEVIEFFSYACPHCHDFEPYLSDWLKAPPGDVQFQRVPVVFQESWAGLAKAHYTLETLGVDEKFSLRMHTAVHAQALPLFRDHVFFDWAAEQGLDRVKVAELYNSDSVRCKVNRAKVMAQQYNVQVVPTLVVDGKFATNLERAGTPARLLTVLDAMILRARVERQEAPAPAADRAQLPPWYQYIARQPTPHSAPPPCNP